MSFFLGGGLGFAYCALFGCVCVGGVVFVCLFVFVVAKLQLILIQI